MLAQNELDKKLTCMCLRWRATNEITQSAVSWAVLNSELGLIDSKRSRVKPRSGNYDVV